MTDWQDRWQDRRGASAADWQSRVIAAERALSDADDTIRRLTAERDAARSALADRHQADVREAAETAAAAQAAIADLDAENGTLRDRIRELEEACAARDRRIADLARERAEAITDLVTADRKIAALREQTPRETSASIAAWADQTFGAPESNMSIFRRAAKEFHELLEKLEIDDNHPHAAAECADVCIVLDRMVHRLGKDMVQERDQKMQINRARTWRVTGDGHGQHLESKEQG